MSKNNSRWVCSILGEKGDNICVSKIIIFIRKVVMVVLREREREEMREREREREREGISMTDTHVGTDIFRDLLLLASLMAALIQSREEPGPSALMCLLAGCSPIDWPPDSGWGRKTSGLYIFWTSIDFPFSLNSRDSFPLFLQMQYPVLKSLTKQSVRGLYVNKVTYY